MTLTQKLIDAVKANPGATSATLSELVQHPRTSVNPMLSQLTKRGVLSRTHAGKTPTNVPYYAYFPAGTTLPNDQEPLSNVKEPLSNVKEKPAKRRPKPADPLDLNALVDTLASSLADTLAQQVAVKLKDKLVQQLHAHLPRLTPPPQVFSPIINEPRVDKRKVLIAGLLPQQAGMIQAEFGDVFDLAFWKDESLQALKHRAESADVTITFTSKIGHAAESAIKTTSTEYHRCVGGMTSLRDMLTKMYVEPSNLFTS